MQRHVLRFSRWSRSLPPASLLLLAAILANEASTAGGFVSRFASPAASTPANRSRPPIGGTHATGARPPGSPPSAARGYHEPTAESAPLPKDAAGGGDRRREETTTEDDRAADAGWIRRMGEYLLSRRDVIFRGNRVAVFASSSPDGDRDEIASMISRIGSEAERLYFVVSPQEEEEGGGGEIGDDDARESWGTSDANMEVVESVYFDDLVDTGGIDVVVLSTKTWRVVHDDPFVNEFLRLTDAWIHMGSEFEWEFSYYSRVIEGANITMW